jgi:hypothetical protein
MTGSRQHHDHPARARRAAGRLTLSALCFGLWGVGGCAATPSPLAERAESASLTSASAPAAENPEPPQAEHASSSESEPADPTLARTFGWVSLAIGGESAIVAAVTSILMLEDKSTRDSGCNAQKVCSTDGYNANIQLSAAAGWNAGAWVVAAAGIGIGAYLILSHPVAEHVRVSVSPAGATLGGTF